MQPFKFDCFSRKPLPLVLLGLMTLSWVLGGISTPAGAQTPPETLPGSGQSPGASDLVNPQTAEDWLETGLAHIQSQSFPAAIEAFQRAIELDGSLFPAHYNLGLARRQTNDLQGAIAAFYRAIEADPTVPLAYSNLGAALLENQSYDAAIAALERAIALDPRLDIAQYNLGLVHQRQNNLALAEQAFQQALVLNPTAPLTFYHLGITYQQQAAQRPLDSPERAQLLNQAQSAWLQATFLNPSYTEALYRLGSLQYEREQYATAIETFRRATQTNPNYPDAYYAAALAFLKLDRSSDAQTLFQYALQLYQSQNRQDWVDRTQAQLDRLGS